MSHITFNARLTNSGLRITSISGRLGDFIFRTYGDGRITAYYKPRHPESLSVRSRSNPESLSVQIREIADKLGLSVASVNYSVLP